MPLSFADPSQSDGLAAQSLATGTPTDFLDNLSSAYDSSRVNDTSIGEQTALSDQYAKYNDQVFKTTGQRLPNPIENELPPGPDEDVLLDKPGAIPQSLYVSEFENYARKMGANPPSYQDMLAAAHSQMYGAAQTQQDVGSRAAGEFGGQFLGSMGATASDPPILASMAFGGGEASSFLTAVGREALMAGGTEALVQPGIQAHRITAGLPGGFEQGAENVGMASLGAAALTSAFRGAGAAYGALRNRAADYLASGAGDAATQDSARYAERYADLQSQNPLVETAAGAAEHVDRLSAAQARLLDPTADVPETQIPDDPASALRDLFATSDQGEKINTASADSTEAPTAAEAPHGSATPASDEGTPAAAMDSAQPVSGPEIATTSSGREVPVQYAVVEASDLIPSQTGEGAPNPAYPQELQPRDRTRAVSQAQIANIAQNLKPALLDRSPTASEGAPIVAPSGVVESGNGRALAIQRAYADNLPSARAYRQYLEKQGYNTQGMDAPVLVRVRQGDMTPAERLSFVREANQSGTLGYSATEQAMVDAAALPDSTLDLYRGGDVEQAQNREFARAFLNTLPQSEHAGMVDAHGQLSQEAIRRIRGALLAKAYGDSDLVAGVVESSDTNIKAIGGALTDAAADWAKMRAGVASGAIPPALDTTGNLLDAVRLVQRARNEGRNVAEFVGQGDVFSGSLDPGTEAWLGLMFRNTKDWTQPTGRDRLASAIRFYAQEAEKVEGGANLFGMEPARPSDILALARRKNVGSGTAGSEPANAGGGLFAHGESVRPGRDAGKELGSSPAAAVSGQSPAAARARTAADSATAGIVGDDVATAIRSGADQLAQAARDSVSNADALRATRETAQRLQASGLPDDMLALARDPAPKPPADDPSLVQFMIGQGGVMDAASIGISPRARPGLVRRAGVSADEMAQRATDAGYLPPGASAKDLADAVKGELAGRKLYARFGENGNPEARAAFENAAAQRQQLRDAFQQLGLDPETMTDDDLRAAVDAIANAPRDEPPVRTDFTDEAIASANQTAAELDRQSTMEERLANDAESDLRAQFADRMDDPAYVEVNGETRAVTARDLFDELSDDQKLIDEFGNCMGGG